MYRLDKKFKPARPLLTYFLVVTLILLMVIWLIWLMWLRVSPNSAINFVKADSTVASVTPKTVVFNNGLFSITLPDTWLAHGRKNPFANQVYYEFENNQLNYKNQWLRVYVDFYPSDFAFNYLLPVTVSNNHLVAGNLSNNCETFNGAPLAASSSQTTANWLANWQGIHFTCDMIDHQTVGTASQAEGYGVTLKSSNGTTHRYFFVYIDFNVEPNYQNLVNAVNSFRVD